MKAFSISTRLLLSYLLVAVLPLAGLALVYLASFETSLRKTLLDNMATIADKKASQIDSYVAERKDDALLLSRRMIIRTGLAELGEAFRAGGLEAPPYRDAARRLAALLEDSGAASEFYDLLLTDTAGNVLFSLRREPDLGTSLLHGPYRSTQLAQGYAQAMRTHQLQLTRFALYAPSGNRPAAFLVAPVENGGEVIGALALQLDVRRLMTVTTDRIGLGQSGETVLAQKDANEAFYTVPLRHVRDAAYRYRVPLHKAALPMQKALAGEQNQGIILDYAGIECIAAWRHLPSLDWGMVVKIDTHEAFAPAARMRRLTYLALTLFLLLSGGAAYFLGRAISRPIQTLTAVADRIAAGDLAQRVPRDGGGELGRLAHAFNHMADALAESRQTLEAKVEARSHELRAVTSLQNAILDRAGALVVLLDREGRIRRFNRACEELTQYSFAEVEGKFVWDLFLTPEEREVVHAEAFSALARNPQALRGSYTNYWVARDGTQRLVEWSNTLLLDEHGEMEFIVSVGIDVTEKAQTEAALQESAVRLNEAQRIAQIGSWELDHVSGGLEWSDEIFRIFEIDPAQFGASYEAFLGLVHPDDRDKIHQVFTTSLENCTPYEIVHRLCMPDGRIKWVSERCETHYDAQGRPLRSTGTVQDITARKQNEEALRLYANVFEHSGESIIITGSDNRILAVNPAFTRLTGYTLDDIRGEDPHVLASGQTPESTYLAMWSGLAHTGYWQGEIIDRRKDGSVYPKWMSVSAVRDPDGRITHYIASFTDITERKQAEAKISQLAYHDTLTGLINRFSLQGQLDQALALARREQRALAVIFLDLDRFKAINDSMGHAVGDQLIVEVARRLRASVRESDIVARLGGDEFVVVLTEVDDANAAAHVADKILHAVAQRYRIADRELHSTASLGIAFFPDDGEDGEALMKNADTAMYHAKSLGRNNVQFFTAEMNQAAVKRLMLDHDLRDAVDNRQFELHYQPQLDNDGCVVGVEALVRWRHPRDGLVSPAVFIPVAEETGLILPLGEWVLDEACRQLRAWRDHGIDGLTMAVNLSAHQLHSPLLLSHVAQALVRHGLAGADLELEVTESVAMHDPDASIRQLRALRDLGVRLSIDDFGTGYSSLSYLKLLPIHTLKLDQSFVRDIETDSNDVAICTATIALAHSLGLAVIAEGVETEAQRQLLAAHRCDFMQGYLFSRPLPAEAALDFMRRRRAA